MFGQPTEKSRKNASKFLPNFKTNSKILIHPDLKNSQYHYIAKIIFYNLHIAYIIGEVMLTPYNFFVITSLMLDGKRILFNDSFTSTELKKLLGIMPSRMRRNNIPLSWLCGNIP